MARSGFDGKKSLGDQPEFLKKKQENKLEGQAAPAKKVKQKQKLIESFTQLVHSVYAGSFNRASLQKTEIKVLGSTHWNTTTEKQQLLDLARQDMALEKTRQLMLLGLRTGGPIGLRIKDFAYEVLRSHPFFQTEYFRNILSTVDEKEIGITVIDAVLARAQNGLASLKNLTSITEKSFKNLQINAAHCLLLLFSMRGISLAKIHSLFQRLIKPSTSDQPPSSKEEIYTLITSRSPEAAAVTSRLMGAQLSEHIRLVREAQLYNERIELKIKNLELKMTELEESLKSSNDNVLLLKNELTQSAHDHAVEKSHWQDDYEQLRGQVMRRMKEEVSLLGEGLHALRRDPPKVHVMIDHAERAIDGLNREMKRVREGDS